MMGIAYTDLICSITFKTAVCTCIFPVVASASLLLLYVFFVKMPKYR